MWIYQKTLQKPINIKNPDPRMAGLIITQYGGPDGEIGASLRYLSQRFAMPIECAKAVLNDIGTEELGHLEMVGTMVRQLLKGATLEQIKEANRAGYFVEHGRGVYPINVAGVPLNAGAFQSKDDIIANLHEDLAAEQKARSVYENLLKVADDPDVIDALRFLRQREVVHFQRFGEVLDKVNCDFNSKHFY